MSPERTSTPTTARRLLATGVLVLLAVLGGFVPVAEVGVEAVGSVPAGRTVVQAPERRRSRRRRPRRAIVVRTTARPLRSLHRLLPVLVPSSTGFPRTTVLRR